MPFEDDYPLASNLRRYLRQTAPFGGEPEVSQSTTSMVPFIKGGSVQDVDDDYNPSSRMMQLYQPEHTASDAYMKHIADMPVREKPPLWRKLAAGFAAFGSRPDDAERVMYGPYHRNLKDWATKLEPLQHASEIERQHNTNSRSFANQVISQEMSDRRLDRMYARDSTLRDQGERRLAQGDERVRQGDERLKQAEERMKIARLVALGGQFEVDDAGNARIIKKDGSTIPVDASYLTFEEKEELKAQTAGRVAKARADNSKDRVVERVIEDPSQPGKYIRVSINLDTGEATPITVKPDGSAATPPKTELEQSRDVTNTALQVKAANPQWAKHIIFDNAGRFKEIKRPGPMGGGIIGPTRDEYNKIYQAIFGKAPEETQKPPVRAGGPGPGPKVNAPPPGRVRVRGPNGETGTIPVGNASSLPPGWRVEGR